MRLTNRIERWLVAVLLTVACAGLTSQSQSPQEKKAGETKIGRTSYDPVAPPRNKRRDYVPADCISPLRAFCENCPTQWQQVAQWTAEAAANCGQSGYAGGTCGEIRYLRKSDRRRSETRYYDPQGTLIGGRIDTEAYDPVCDGSKRYGAIATCLEFQTQDLCSK